MNKAIVDYTSPALCTPVTPFLPIGDAAVVNMPEEDRAMDIDNICNKNLVNIARVVPDISLRTDRHTDRHNHCCCFCYHLLVNKDLYNHHNTNFATAPAGEVNVRKV